MRFSPLAGAGLAFAFLPVILAQISTKCDPTKQTCPATPGLGTSSYSIDFTTTPSGTQPSDWTLANYEYVTYNTNGRKNGAELSFLKEGDAPTMWSNWYFLFGRVDVVAQAAPGSGIVSSIVLFSDDLDEIDWEWRGSYDTIVQTNYFGKAITGAYNHSTSPTVSSPTTAFHTYSIDWTPTVLTWLFDGQVVRTLKASDCQGVNNQYPQSPMKISLGLWDAGDPDHYNSWGGGKTPIPPPAGGYSLYVKSLKVTNANPADLYTWTDKSGSWQSIKGSNSTKPSTSSSNVPTQSVKPSIPTSPMATLSIVPSTSQPIIPTTVPGANVGRSSSAASVAPVASSAKSAAPVATSSAAANAASVAPIATSSPAAHAAPATLVPSYTSQAPPNKPVASVGGSTAVIAPSSAPVATLSTQQAGSITGKVTLDEYLSFIRAILSKYFGTQGNRFYRRTVPKEDGETTTQAPASSQPNTYPASSPQVSHPASSPQVSHPASSPQTIHSEQHPTSPCTDSKSSPKTSIPQTNSHPQITPPATLPHTTGAVTPPVSMPTPPVSSCIYSTMVTSGSTSVSTICRPPASPPVSAPTVPVSSCTIMTMTTSGSTSMSTLCTPVPPVTQPVPTAPSSQCTVSTMTNSGSRSMTTICTPVPPMTQPRSIPISTPSTVMTQVTSNVITTSGSIVTLQSTLYSTVPCSECLSKSLATASPPVVTPPASVPKPTIPNIGSTNMFMTFTNYHTEIETSPCPYTSGGKTLTSQSVVTKTSGSSMYTAPVIMTTEQSTHVTSQLTTQVSSGKTTIGSQAMTSIETATRSGVLLTVTDYTTKIISTACQTHTAITNGQSSISVETLYSTSTAPISTHTTVSALPTTPPVAPRQTVTEFTTKTLSTTISTLSVSNGKPVITSIPITAVVPAHVTQWTTKTLTTLVSNALAAHSHGAPASVPSVMTTVSPVDYTSTEWSTTILSQPATTSVNAVGSTVTAPASALVTQAIQIAPVAPLMATNANAAAVVSAYSTATGVSTVTSVGQTVKTTFTSTMYTTMTPGAADVAAAAQQTGAQACSGGAMMTGGTVGASGAMSGGLCAPTANNTMGNVAAASAVPSAFTGGASAVAVTELALLGSFVLGVLGAIV